MNTRIRARAFIKQVAIAAVIATASCADPKDTGVADVFVVVQGILGMHNPFNLNDPILAQPGRLSRTIVQKAQTPCEGSVGSVLPPIAFEGCGNPFLALQNTQEWISTEFGFGSGLNYVFLPDVQKYWVRQTSASNCWAAALETARRYRHFRYLTQSDIYDFALSYCPILGTQREGASAFQITYIIAQLMERYHERNGENMICSDMKCILDTLKSGHPIIMLNSSHAILIVGADYFDNNIPTVKSFKILDPASVNGEIETVPVWKRCMADAFIPY